MLGIALVVRNAAVGFLHEVLQLVLEDLIPRARGDIDLLRALRQRREINAAPIVEERPVLMAGMEYLDQ